MERDKKMHLTVKLLRKKEEPRRKFLNKEKQ
jgi:hypothetical protein